MQEENVIESNYLKILGELTQIMRSGNAPEKTLDTLRLYVESDKANVSKAVHELRKSILAMDDSARADWRQRAIPRLNAALDEFAYAQLHLQKKLNDEQKWELGEILSLLKP